MIRSSQVSASTLARKRRAAAQLPWAIRQRLAFIESRLFWSGRINRADIVAAFAVHETAASRDLTEYQKLAPRNALYDRSAKVYRTGPRFSPVLTEPTTDALFGHALLHDSFPAPSPLFEWVQPPRRAADPVVVRNIVEAAGEALALQVLYRSMNNPDGTWRWIEPRAVVFDGQRWHCRAWCQAEQQFRDFNLGRIARISESVPASTDEADAEWEATVEVALRPHRALSEPQQRLVADDYDMKERRLALPCRRALLGYLLVNLGLDRDLDPPRQVLELEDPGILELAPWIARQDAAQVPS